MSRRIDTRREMNAILDACFGKGRGMDADQKSKLEALGRLEVVRKDAGLMLASCAGRGPTGSALAAFSSVKKQLSPGSELLGFAEASSQYSIGPFAQAIRAAVRGVEREVGVALGDSPEVLAVSSYANRKIVVVGMPGGDRQGFYQSSGRSSAGKGKFFPFDGVAPTPVKDASRKSGLGVRERFDKDRYRTLEPGLDHYGDQVLKDVAASLDDLEEAGSLHLTVEVSGQSDLNVLLSGADHEHPAMENAVDFAEAENLAAGMSPEKARTLAAVAGLRGPTSLSQRLLGLVADLLGQAADKVRALDGVRHDSVGAGDLPARKPKPRRDEVEMR